MKVGGFWTKKSRRRKIIGHRMIWAELWITATFRMVDFFRERESERERERAREKFVEIAICRTNYCDEVKKFLDC